VKQFVIDTNALLSFVTDRNSDQQEFMNTIFEMVSSAKAALLCPQNVIAEFVYVMETIYNQPKTLIRSIIADFVLLPGVTIDEKTDIKTVFSLWPEQVEDFGDAIVAACAASHKGSIVITFDRRFIRSLKARYIPFRTLKQSKS